MEIRWTMEMRNDERRGIEYKAMKVALYLRVSTEDQAREGYSLEVQREYLESFAVREGYEVFVRPLRYCKNLYDIFAERHGHGRFAARTMA